MQITTSSTPTTLESISGDFLASVSGGCGKNGGGACASAAAITNVTPIFFQMPAMPTMPLPSAGPPPAPAGAPPASAESAASVETKVSIG
jgi:hypothetical protein